jgi:hypothetical protein
MLRTVPCGVGCAVRCPCVVGCSGGSYAVHGEGNRAWCLDV